MTGKPFTIASHAPLTAMIAQVAGPRPGDFVHTFGDAHLSLDHLEQTQTRLAHASRTLPPLRRNHEVRSLFDCTFEDIAIEGCALHPAIKAPVAV